MVIKMEKTRMEKQGRTLIPKQIRERLHLRSGEVLLLEESKGRIIFKVFKSPEEFSSQLRGCVKGSKIRPLELKKMWEM